eukprot:629156-Karenia_brevis.AAC.1
MHQCGICQNGEQQCLPWSTVGKWHYDGREIMEERLESVRAEWDQLGIGPELLKIKIFQQTWNEIKHANDAAGGN